ncbi:hypothetical protein IWX78_000296 [Mycetocola sp. CAN_C7]|uniref:hypothetical protein n=1 Tax=Mycetocola sp. CAN_C7 TaxID=2787724 RepID=UPI0018CA2E18
MSDPLDHNENAPDGALLGPGSTATGGGTSEETVEEERDSDTHVPALDPESSDSTQLADDRFRHPDL